MVKVLQATWPRCQGHYMLNALAYANKLQRPMVSGAVNGLCIDVATQGRAWFSLAKRLVAVALCSTRTDVKS